MMPRRVEVTHTTSAAVSSAAEITGAALSLQHLHICSPGAALELQCLHNLLGAAD